MDESEFVVVDDEHNGSVELGSLNETVQAYEVARDSLLKGVSLLHDTLNLTMELALKNSRPDFDSDSKDLIKRILKSLHTAPEAVLRDHVKSLCSKLVAVKKEYEDLVVKFESLAVERTSDSSLVHLADILVQTDSLLPPSSDAKPVDNVDIDELCCLAESVRDRVKLFVEARSDSASESFNQPEQQSDLKDSEVAYSKKLHSSASKEDFGMDISRIVREEVISVLQSEMSNIMEHQKNLIQQVLKPISKVEQTVSSPEDLCNKAEGNSESFQVISSPNPTGHNRKLKPSYLPADERPLCPKCQILMPDRAALETHLDSCLK